MVMALPMLSQNTSPIVSTIINTKGDTLIQMKLADAKIVLAAVLDKEIVDSLLTVYASKDEVNRTIIMLQKYDIKKLQEKSANQEILSANLEKIIANKDTELQYLNEVIKKQKKEIRKQKILKIIGYTAAVALPVATVVIMSK